jgi:hypothetical protein
MLLFSWGCSTSDTGRDPLPADDGAEDPPPPRPGRDGRGGTGGSAGAQVGGGAAGTTGAAGSTGAAGAAGTSGRPDAGAPADDRDASVTPDEGMDALPSTADATAPAARDGGARDGKVAPPPFPTGAAARPCRFHFCESFENGTEGASPPGWSSNGAVVVSSTRAAFGKHALRIRNSGINPGLFVVKGGVFPPGKNTIYLRLFMWFERRPGSGGLVHWTSAEVRGSGGPTVRALGGISQFNFSNRNNLLFNIDPGGGEKALGDAAPYPRITDQLWECFEVMLTRGAKDQVRTWWNEEPRTRLDYDGTWGARFVFPTFSSLALGFATYQNVGAFEVYIDEVAVHHERIGCRP